MKHNLGLIDATMLVVGSMIGSGFLWSHPISRHTRSGIRCEYPILYYFPASGRGI